MEINKKIENNKKIDENMNENQDENFNDLELLFPNINIHTYELINKLDNKTTSLFIPEGDKRFVWFTKYKHKPICLLLNKNEKKYTIEFRYACFSDELTKGIGTILYGTFIENDNSFYCESMYFFKGLSITGSPMDRFVILKNIFQYVYFSNFSSSMNFYLPYMSNSKFIFEATNLPYSISHILQFQNNKLKIFHLNELIGCFKISKRNEYEDVYELSIYNQGNYEFYSTALVNDLKTSDFIKNKLFNLNVDYRNSQFLNDSFLEEIENKYYNDSDFFVGCIFIPEFRKWKPIIKKDHADILKTIQIIEKKNI